ncbi:hypothetical protein ACWGNU_28790 [Paenibacillus lautus]
MKRFLKTVLSLSLVFSLVAALNTSKVSADAKTPDALNLELEQQKMHELSISRNTEGKIYLDEPVILNFDDGSSVEYKAIVEVDGEKINPNNYSINEITPSATKINFVIEKTYNLIPGVSKATVVSRVDNTTFKPSPFDPASYVIDLSGDPGDIYQQQWTQLAVVKPGLSRAKNIYTSLYDKGIRVEARGEIEYNLDGLLRVSSYQFYWEVNPQYMDRPYFVTSY